LHIKSGGYTYEYWPEHFLKADYGIREAMSHSVYKADLLVSGRYFYLQDQDKLICMERRKGVKREDYGTAVVRMVTISA